MIRLGPLIGPLTPAAAPVDGSAPSDVSPSDLEPEPSRVLAPRPVTRKKTARRKSRHIGRWLLFGFVVTVASLIAFEFRTSFFQAHGLAHIARNMTFQLVEGSASRGEIASMPNPGPYDLRLGYATIPLATDRLIRGGYVQTSHVELSAYNRKALEFGLPPIYHEKVRGGLRLEDGQGSILYESTIPREVYPNYSAIAPLIVQTLLYAENRQILEESLPYRNPTIEWERLSRAVLDFGMNKIDRAHPVTGASTVATQLEKLRHSPGGRTLTSKDKLRQMIASSLRAYQNGPLNLEARRAIVCDYINSLPLAATPSQGEIIGLADGLRGWFSADPYKVNELLRMSDEAASEAGKFEARALAYREAVTLLLAAKRPSGYLVDNRDALTHRVDTYLALLEREHIISSALHDAAFGIRPPFFRDPTREKPKEILHEIPAQTEPVPTPPVPTRSGDRNFAERKGIDAIRVALLNLTGADSLYALDRLDLTASTTLDRPSTTAVARTLQSLSQPEAAGKAGLFGYRMLNPDDAEGIIYSFTLYQRENFSGKTANVLRVQADNYPQPLNINQGTKLELGSTAKLRTLAAYLEIITELHKNLSGLTAAELESLPRERDDALTAWAMDYLATASDRELAPMLEASMLRTYSANNAEGFFTGGGVHTFSNFDGKDNGRILTVREALQRSVNLVFIRVMRDIVRYRMAQHPAGLAVLRAEVHDPRRREYLNRFADFEGRQFLEQFYRRYSPHPESALATAIASSNRGVAPKVSPTRFAVIYRTMYPGEHFDAYLAAANMQGLEFKRADEAERLFDEFAPGSKGTPSEFNWNDLGYIAKIHPLELWTATYLAHHPGANFEEIMRESTTARHESYSWLFRPNLRREQNSRISILLERDAFVDIHRSWARLGFPFPELVPSLATAIGSSGDTPDALATLAGIILNDGVRYPSVRVPKLHFAANTPFETTFERELSEGERLLPSEVASLMHKEMIGVVQHGTAFGAFGSVKLADGQVIPVGGKTGTGDNRVEHYAANGSVIESRVRNRTATFVFTIGEHFFGTLVVYAEGASAQNKTFTSALAVQVFRNLAPQLEPLIARAN